MVNLLDMLKDQIGDSIFSQAGQFLGADESGVKSAMGAAMPAILGSMITNSSSQKGAEGLLDMITSGGHDGGIFDSLGGLLGGGDTTSGFLNSGSGILKSLMGNKLGSVVDVIASVSGMKKGLASSVMSMAAPLVMGMVGRYVKQKALDAIGLGKFLGGQSKHVANALPAGMGSLLGFSADSGMGDRIEEVAETAKEAVTTATEGGTSMLRRVLPLLLLLAVGYFGWQWWQGSNVGDKIAEGANAVVDKTKDMAETAGDVASDAASAVGDKVSDAANTVAEGAKDAANTAGEMVGDALDATTKAAREALSSITFAAGSVGEKFNNWLSSGAEGSENFQFNNLTFAKGSANIEDMTEVNNLAAVLKAYPNVHIEIGGHTDSSGNADSNMTLSQQRAESVKVQLVTQGVSEDRVTAKGYGSTMPTTDNAADAANRRVEIKVTQK